MYQIVRKLFWVLPLLCFLLCGCGGKDDGSPPWLYEDKNNRSHSLNRFECTVKDGRITMAEYVFHHPYESNLLAGMAAKWKEGNEDPVYSDVERMEGSNTFYNVEQLPLCLDLIRQHPESLPEDCRISIWMPDEDELQELLTKYNGLICNVHDGTFRSLGTGEFPIYLRQIPSFPKGAYPLLWGVVLVESGDGEFASLVVLEGIMLN